MCLSRAHAATAGQLFARSRLFFFSGAPPQKLLTSNVWLLGAFTPVEVRSVRLGAACSPHARLSPRLLPFSNFLRSWRRSSGSALASQTSRLKSEGARTAEAGVRVGFASTARPPAPLKRVCTLRLSFAAELHVNRHRSQHQAALTSSLVGTQRSRTRANSFSGRTRWTSRPSPSSFPPLLSPNHFSAPGGVPDSHFNAFSSLRRR